MADFRPQSIRNTFPSNKNQPRRLSSREAPQPCNWVDCHTRAVSEYRDKIYCASHLLKVLQKQWQE
jgi:hypothetical protein